MDDVASDCVFCAVIHDGAEAKILREWDDAIAIIPKGGGVGEDIHVLVIPREHAATVLDAPQLAGLVMQRGAEYAAERGWTDANYIYNCGKQAGQTVFHIHLHVLRRSVPDHVMMPWPQPLQAAAMPWPERAVEMLASDLRQVVLTIGENTRRAIKDGQERITLSGRERDDVARAALRYLRTPTSGNLKQRIGDNIRAARKAHGWTQQQLADRVPTSVASVSLTENGRRGHLPMDVFVRYADALDVPPIMLLREPR